MQRPLHDVDLADLLSGGAPKSATAQADTAQQVRELIQKLREGALSDLQLALDTAEIVIAMADDSGIVELRIQSRTVTASVLCLANRFEDALQCLERGRHLAIDDRLIGELSSAAVQPNARLGRLDVALDCATEAVRCFDPLRHRIETGRAYTNLGVVYRMRSEPKQAIEQFSRALELLDDPMMVAQIRSNRAEVLLELARFTEAESEFREVSEAFLRQGARRAAAIAIGNLADLLGRSGRFQLALEEFDRAINLLSDNIAPGDSARLLAEMAEVMTAAGRFRSARIALIEAIRRLRQLGMIGESLRAEVCLIGVLMELGCAEDAREHLRRAIPEAGQANMPLVQGRLFVASGRLHAAIFDYHAAEQDIQRAINVLPDHPIEFALAQIARATTALESGNVQAARHAASVLSATAIDIHPVVTMQLLKVSAAISRTEGNPGRAINALTEAVRIIERTRGAFTTHDLRVGWLGRHVETYYDLLSVLLEAGSRSVGEAFRIAESARCRSLLEEMHCGSDLLERIRVNALDTNDDERHAVAQVSEARRSFAVAELNDADIGTLEAERTVASTALRQSTRFRELFGEPATLDEVQRSLPARTALVEFVPKGDSLHVFVIHHNRVDQFPIRARVCDAAELVERIRFDAERWLIRRDGRSAETDSLSRQLRTLFHMLVEPWIDVVDGERLIIVPHGPIHAAPLHAAHRESRQSLIDRFIVSYAPSASLIAASAQRSESRRPIEGEPIVISFHDDDAPEIDREAKALMARFPSALHLAGAHATKSAVQRALREAPIVHFACHARFDADDSLSSGLLLADGWLSASEVYGASLPGALVTLSACEAGRTSVASGNELYGLMRPFLAAGAHTVLASQWLVDDAFSAEIMPNLYRHIITGRQGAEALALVQREQHRRGIHPALWAGITAVSAQ